MWFEESLSVKEQLRSTTEELDSKRTDAETLSAQLTR